MRTFAALCLITCLLSAFGAARVEAACHDVQVAPGLTSPAYAAEVDALIQYFGHNLFQITTRQGPKIVMDPLAPGRYPTPHLTPHVVTVGSRSALSTITEIIVLRPNGARE